MQNQRRMSTMACCIAPVVTAALLLMIYAVNGIVPFGTATVVGGDLEQTYAAMYEQFQQILTGRQSFFYSFMTGMGTALSSDTMNGGFFSPLNLLLLLVPNGGMLPFLSWFVLLKVMLTSLAGTWYAGKRFSGLPLFWRVFLGVAYGLSGYILTQYHNIIWLEVVALTPPLMYQAEKLIRGGKLLPYALLLGAALLIEYYLAAMACLFIFLVGGAYILFLLPREERGRATLRIAAATFCGLCLGAVAMAPSLYQLSGAARMSREGSGVLIPFSGFAFDRGMALCTLSFGLVLIPWYLRFLGKRGEKGAVRFVAASLVIMLLPLFFDGTDNLWHFGGHIAFPYRYGFLTVFLVLALCGAALEKRAVPGEKQNWRGRSPRQKGGMILAACLTLMVFSYLMIRDGSKINQYLDWKNAMISVLTLSAVAAYGFLFCLPEGKMVRTLLAGVLCLQTIVYGAGLIPPLSPAVTLESSSAVAAGKLSSAFEKTDYTCRVKNEDDTLTLNYGRFLDQPTVSAFTGSMTQTTMDAMKALGYGVSTYSIQDCGGTLFSDALLGQKKMISNDSRFASDPCYSYLSSSGEYSVYDCVFTLPMGMVGTDALSALSKEDDWDPFALQNRLYRAISRTGEDIFQEVPLSSLAVDENGRYLLSVEGNQRLYAVDASAMRCPLSISAEGESGARITAKAHPQVYYDGIADLGSYSQERVRITYSPDLSENQPVVMLALLNLDRLQAFTASAADTDATFYGSSVSLTVSGEADGDWLLLPVQAQKGWTCTVDGAAASVEPVLNAFLGTRLTKGPHLVTFTYTTPYFYAGLAVTAAGVLACLLLWMYEYRKKRTPFLLAPGKGAERIFGWLLCLCWWGAVTAAYVLPTAYGLLAWYRQMR